MSLTTKEDTTAPKGRSFQEVTTDFFKFENFEDSVEGVLLEKSTQQFREGVVGRYAVQSDASDKPTTFLGSTAIDDLLKNIPEGTYIRLTYVGEIATRSGMKMKDMKLEVATS